MVIIITMQSLKKRHPSLAALALPKTQLPSHKSCSPLAAKRFEINVGLRAFFSEDKRWTYSASLSWLLRRSLKRADRWRFVGFCCWEVIQVSKLPRQAADATILRKWPFFRSSHWEWKSWSEVLLDFNLRSDRQGPQICGPEAFASTAGLLGSCPCLGLGTESHHDVIHVIWCKQRNFRKKLSSYEQ